ncbi:MAG: ATP-dependent DNA helicase, partial [Rhodospirillaceae bacterium]|nr:ATP-dependent DNA helicase [Rhodospirillaceae bacterium]
ADSAFSAHLTGRETHDLRRWLLGGEDSMRGGVKSRARGLKRRVEDLVAGHAEAEAALDALSCAARALPASGWEGRLGGRTPHGPTEAFLLSVQDQVLARAEEPNSLYSLEVAPAPLSSEVAETLPATDRALEDILGPARGLAAILRRRLSEEVDTLEASFRQRMEATARTLEHRALQQVAAWRAMLKDLSATTPPEYADWFGIERIEGRNIDLGFYRHWIDPTIPFAQSLADVAHGMVVTSATLRDAGDGPEGGWDAAALTGGTGHFTRPALRTAVPSPFHYAEQTRVFIVHDIGRTAGADALAAAMRGLFLASGGGALGLFTAIQRLKDVHARIKSPLAEAGLDLLAQHVDGLDTSTLIDLFRAEENTCLLGTDAVRDGVDVPGRSLRLIAFDRVPWPRPGMLYRARREAFGGTAYTDRLTRMKLRQAFGRLIRRADDRGVFVLLAPLPSRLLSAFPDGVVAERMGIKDAIERTRDFLGT